MALLDPVFADKPGMTPQEVERRRKLAEQLLAGSKQPLTHPLQAVAEMLQGGVGAWNEHKAAKGEEAGRQHRADMIGKAFFGGTTPASTSPSLPSDLGGSPATSTAMATMPAPNSGDLRGGIISTATALGIAPEDLATAISYETAGTFDPTKRGPTTQWGQHRGLIQFGEPQAKQYGVNWDDPLGSQLGPDGAIAKYLRDTGVKPGMGLLDIYSAINAGGVGRYNRSDANNGGAPGTVRDKVEKQMAGHRQKALALLGMNGQTQAPAVAALDALAGGKAAPPSITDAEAKEILSRPRPADAQPYSGPGSIIDPAGVAQLEQTRLEQERAARYAAMPGWMQEMIPQSAAPLSDDQFAARFATTGGPAPEMRDGTQMPGAQQFIAERMAGFAPPQATNPQQQMLAQALTGATLADDRIPMAGGQLGFAPIQQMPAVSQLPQQQAMAQALTGGQQAQAAPGISPQMIQELLGNPWTEDIGQQLLGTYLDQQQQANDPMRRLQLEKGQLELERLRNPARETVTIGNRLVDRATGEVIADFSTNEQGFRQATPQEAAAYGAAGGQFGPDGRFYPINPPSGMSIESDGQGGFRVVQGPGAGNADKPFTEGQSKDNVFSTRARGALPTLDKYSDALTGYGDRLLDIDPTGVVRGNLQSDDYQVARAAGDEFLQAILRKDTGAAITAQEQALYGKTYLDQPGDNEAVRKYKKEARARAVAAIEAGMSPAQMLAQEKALSTSPAPTVPEQGDGPAAIQTEEEYNALPSGALFIDPDDGKTYRKP